MTERPDYGLDSNAVDLLVRLRTIDPAGTESELDRIASQLRMRLEVPAGPDRPTPMARRIPGWVIAAAAAVVALTLGVGLLAVFSTGEEPPVATTMPTPTTNPGPERAAPLAGVDVADLVMVDGFQVAGVQQVLAANQRGSVWDLVVIAERDTELCAVTVERTASRAVQPGTSSDALPAVEPSDPVCAAFFDLGSFELGAVDMTSLSISPDGRYAAFSAAAPENRSVGTPGPEQDIYLFDMETAGLATLVGGPDAQHDPVWLDAQTIVFYRGASASSAGALMAVDVDTRAVEVVVELPAEPINAIGSGDLVNRGLAVSEGVVYVSFLDADRELLTFAAVDVATRTLDPILETSPVPRLGAVAFTADGAHYRPGPGFVASYVEFASETSRRLDLWTNTEETERVLLSGIGANGVVEGAFVGGDGESAEAALRVTSFGGEATNVELRFPAETVRFGRGPSAITAGRAVIELGVEGIDGNGSG